MVQHFVLPTLEKNVDGFYVISGFSGFSSWICEIFSTFLFCFLLKTETLTQSAVREKITSLNLLFPHNQNLLNLQTYPNHDFRMKKFNLKTLLKTKPG